MLKSKWGKEGGGGVGGRYRRKRREVKSCSLFYVFYTERRITKGVRRTNPRVLVQHTTP